MQKGLARLLVTNALKRRDVRFVWFPGNRTHRKAGVSGRRQDYYMRHLRNWDDYRRLKKQPWPEGKKNTVVREDLIHDVQRGLLNFSFDSRDKPEEEETICDEMLVEGDEVGSIHRATRATEFGVTRRLPSVSALGALKDT